MDLPTQQTRTLDLSSFTLSDMASCAAAIRKLGRLSESVEATAQEIVGYLYEHLEENGRRSLALIRLYKTHPFGKLPERLRNFASRLARGEELDPATRCLTLMATAGEEPAWNAAASSREHQAIPLASAEMLDQSPMISQLLVQLGLPAGFVLDPDEQLMTDVHEKAFNVFHVPEAAGSEHIPAQDFVRRYSIRSVLGFGGILPGSDVFAVIMFSKTPIPRETADLFRPVAVSAKLAMLRTSGSALFDEEGSDGHS